VKKSFLWMIEGILGRRCMLQAANSPMSHHSNFSSDVCMRGRISEDTVVPPCISVGRLGVCSGRSAPEQILNLVPCGYSSSSSGSGERATDTTVVIIHVLIRSLRPCEGSPHYY
jgi:hypothetical protein